MVTSLESTAAFARCASRCHGVVRMPLVELHRLPLCQAVVRHFTTFGVAQTTELTSDTGSSSSALSEGAFAGIFIGVFAGVALIAVAVVVLLRNRKTTRKSVRRNENVDL